MLRALSSSLPPHIQAVFIQNSLKLWTAHCIGLEEVEAELMLRLEVLVGSEALEVQERSSTGLHLLRYVAKQREKGEAESVKAELETFFAGELNPVAPKAQKKVPVPEGLDLDAWINEPELEEEEEDSEDDMKNLGGQVRFSLVSLIFIFHFLLCLKPPINSKDVEEGFLPCAELVLVYSFYVQVFVRDEPEETRKRTNVEATPEELSAARSNR